MADGDCVPPGTMELTDEEDERGKVIPCVPVESVENTPPRGPSALAVSVVGAIFEGSFTPDVMSCRPMAAAATPGGWEGRPERDPKPTCPNKGAAEEFVCAGCCLGDIPAAAPPDELDPTDSADDCDPGETPLPPAMAAALGTTETTPAVVIAAGNDEKEASKGPTPLLVTTEGNTKPTNGAALLGTKATAAAVVEVGVVVSRDSGLVTLASASSDKNCMTFSVRASLSLLRSSSVAQWVRVSWVAFGGGGGEEEDGLHVHKEKTYAHTHYTHCSLTTHICNKYINTHSLIQNEPLGETYQVWFGTSGTEHR